jgi:uncharacterized protein
MRPFRNPTENEISEFLQKIRSIAVLGISADSARPSHSVAQSMQGFGYRIVPINPTLGTVLGEHCWPTLEAAVAGGAAIDVVDVFRQPQHVAPIVEDCLRLRMPALWLQDGVVDPVAAAKAQAAGLFTVMDRCIYRDRARLAVR